ncbi:hypothetical protein MYX78_03665 [Acidobacteria bacterium AH-259-G07]|nr:hypothetical protein [Acidobacteria bacterium AH-259-G07]
MKGLQLPARLQRIVQLADMEANDLAADKGGLKFMTAGERAMLSNWKLARQCTLIILHELVERGAIQEKDGVWDLQPGLARLGPFLGQERAALQALGLQRKERNITTLSQILSEESES